MLQRSKDTSLPSDVALHFESPNLKEQWQEKKRMAEKRPRSPCVGTDPNPATSKHLKVVATALGECYTYYHFFSPRTLSLFLGAVAIVVFNALRRIVPEERCTPPPLRTFVRLPHDDQ